MKNRTSSIAGRWVSFLALVAFLVAAPPATRAPADAPKQAEPAAPQTHLDRLLKAKRQAGRHRKTDEDNPDA